MLKGIDISNWQVGFNIKSANIDFVIVKATEGTWFVDKYCNGFIQQAIDSNKLWGFYHFANNGNPEQEAKYFYANCVNYFKKGIPVLDIEDNNIKNWGEYADRFVKKLYELSGVYCMIYTSASNLYKFSNYPDVYNNCGLWLAGYPNRATYFIDETPPYDIKPWKIVAIWQFTDHLHIQDYCLDGDIAYMDEKAWKLYAGVDKSEIKTTSNKTFKDIDINDAISRIAIEAINGQYGNGEKRKENIYKIIQARANELINGKV